MPESRSHKQGKGKAAQTEVPIPGNRRLDAIRGSSGIEVERSGTEAGIRRALSRLGTQTNKNKILRVPQNDMEMAAQIAQENDAHLNITNLSKTKRRRT